MGLLDRPSLIRRHPKKIALVLVLALGVVALAALGRINSSAAASAERACAAAVQGQSMNAFREAMRAQGRNARYLVAHPGEPVLMVDFPAIGVESYVCVVRARGDEIRGSEVSFHD
jgi:type II secretory pathway pseudopilin PulG